MELWAERTLMGLEEPSVEEGRIEELGVPPHNHVVLLQLVADGHRKTAIINEALPLPWRPIGTEGVGLRRMAIDNRLEGAAEESSHEALQISRLKIPGYYAHATARM